MNKWRTEYKVLLVLIILFIIVLVFFLLKTGYFDNLQQQRLKNSFVHCTEENISKGIDYTSYVCTIQDEYGENYTIEYPQITEKNADIKKLNRSLKRGFDKAYQSIQYTKTNQKLQLESYQRVYFQVYHSKHIVSFLVGNQDMIGTVLNRVTQYRVYNIDTTNYKVLDEDEIKKELGINRDYSSTLKGIIVKMYLEKFRYDYNNELDVYRNTYIDDSIKNVTYQAIQNVYVDDSGTVHFILYLFNPDYGETIPYNFSIDNSGNTNYEILQ